jgi:hypothetical protein
MSMRSCRLLPPFLQATQRIRFPLLFVHHDPHETDLVATASSVATAIALGLGEGPESHDASL